MFQDRRPAHGSSEPSAGAGIDQGSRPTPPIAEVQEYKLLGEVRKIDKDAREVTILHQAIPGFMEAMTMPFHLEDPAILDELRPGDEVEGKLRVERENGQTKDYRLHDLTVTKPALAPPLVLDLSGTDAPASPPAQAPRARRAGP